MLESPLVLFNRLPGLVRLLVAGTFVNKLGTFIIPYLTLVLSREFHLSGGQVGVVVMAYGLGSIVSILTGGVLTDRLGRRLTLEVSLFGSGVIAMAMGLAPSVHVFLPLLVLLGFVADLYRPASSAIMGDLLPSRDRAVGFAALRVSVNLGFAVGVALGGFIADWSWRALFFGDGLTTVLFGVIVYAFIHETRPTDAQPEATAARGLAPSPWRDFVFLQMVLGSVAFSLAFFADFTVFPLTVTLSAGYAASVYGMLVGLNGLLIGLFEMSAVAWLKRYRRLRVGALGMLLVGIGFGLVGLFMHWAWFLVCVLLWTAGEILAVPQQMSFIADWAPPAARGRYFGLYGATWSLGMAICPLLFLPLHARLSEAAFWPIMLLLVAPPAILLLRLDTAADRPECLRGLSDVAPSDAELRAAMAEPLMEP